MNTNFHFWFDSKFTQLYIHPVSLKMNLTIFEEQITTVLYADPEDSKTKNHYSALYKSVAPPIEDTIFVKLIGMNFGDFWSNTHEEPDLNLYEFVFILSSGKKISSCTGGLLIENINANFIHHSLSGLVDAKRELDNLEIERFYIIADKKIISTKHITQHPIEYICGLFIPEIYGDDLT